MRRFLCQCLVICGVVFSASSAQAAAILIPVAGSIDASVSFLFADPSTAIYDIRGAAIVQVQDETATPLGTEFLLGGNPFPANNLVLTNLTVTEAVDLNFNFGSSIFSPSFPGPDWFVLQVTGTPITGITDTGLAPFVGNSSAQFLLLTPEGIPIFGADQERIGLTFNYSLSSLSTQDDDVTEVPEPATLGLLGTGLLAVLRKRRQKTT